MLFEINSQIDMFSGKSDEPSQNKTNPKFHSRRHLYVFIAYVECKQIRSSG